MIVEVMAALLLLTALVTVMEVLAMLLSCTVQGEVALPRLVTAG
jgi:hypothetical protein